MKRGELTATERERYERNLLVADVGETGQMKLRSGSVLIVGAGGLGGYVAEQLVRAGVGRLGIVDFDRVSPSNLQRQNLYTLADVGRSKCEAARERLRAIDPETAVDTFDLRLTEENWRGVVETARYDLIVDCCDNFECRYLTDRISKTCGIPLVYGTAQQWGGQVSVFNHAGAKGYAELYPEPAPTQKAVGVLPSVVGVIGSLQAAEAMKLLLGETETLAGKLLVYDAKKAIFHTLIL